MSETSSTGRSLPVVEFRAGRARVSSSDVPQPGRVLARTYRLTRILGKGSMGTVFEAEHLRLGKSFAIKIMRTEELDDDRARRRFAEEVRALAAVSSDHVVQVVDCGDHRGVPYLVMERLVGADLRNVLRAEGRLSPERALRVGLGAALGLAAVHRAGLVHRDLKPANLFLTRRSDGRELVKILDFGVARSRAGNGTKNGALIGTVHYMAPEQLADGSAVGPSSDVYSLGCVLYECLAGEPAHSGGSVEELMYSILHRRPKSLHERAGLSAEVSDLVEWAMAHSPAVRCATAHELATALRTLPELCGDGTLRDATGRDTTATDHGAAPVSQRPPPLSPRLVQKVAAACVLSLAAGVCLGTLRARPTPEASAARAPAPPGPRASHLLSSVVAEPPQGAAPAHVPEAPSASVPAAAPSSRPRGDAPGRARARADQARASSAWNGPFETQNPYVE